ncbi:hypothetical protein SAMN04488556_4104 [Halostagnicola kamekurae]|uniref:Uncharacterized protein n=1 Tax=Halostagnicola kamekurae TaxID=619731 RepID=A0A1I6UV36_9EURY|nr:hypothetical protein SAMN04488556_4104 [Halostagnicola kamekurae]
MLIDALGLLWVASSNAFEIAPETLPGWVIPHDIGHRDLERHDNNLLRNHH